MELLLQLTPENRMKAQPFEKFSRINENRKLHPGQRVTRAGVACLLYRILGLYAFVLAPLGCPNMRPGSLGIPALSAIKANAQFGQRKQGGRVRNAAQPVHRAL